MRISNIIGFAPPSRGVEPSVSFREAVQDRLVHDSPRFQPPSSGDGLGNNQVQTNPHSARAFLIKKGHSYWPLGKIDLVEAIDIQNALRQPAMLWHMHKYNAHIETARSNSILLEFSPATLIAVREGIKRYSDEHDLYYEGEHDHVFDDPKTLILSDEELQSFIGIKIRRLFSTIADDYAIEEEFTPKIGTEGGFNDIVENYVFRRFAISRKWRKVFLDSLYWSIWNFLSYGGQISGDWGKLVAANTNLYMRIIDDKSPVFAETDDVTLSFEA